MKGNGSRFSIFLVWALLAFLVVTPLGWAVEKTPPPNTATQTKPVETTPPKEPALEPVKEQPVPTEKDAPMLEKATEKESGSELNKDYGKVQLPDSDSISFIKSVMALCFVLGLIFLAAYFYKRLSGIKTTGFRSNRVPIDMVGHMALGEKKFLAVVAIQNKHYFIGITPSTINLLSPLELEFPPRENETTTDEGDFESIFKRAKLLLQQRGKK